MSTRNEVQIRINAVANTRQAKRAIESLSDDFRSFAGQISAAKFKILGGTAAITGVGLVLKKAFLNEALKKGEDIVKRVGDDYLSAADKVGILKTSFVEVKNAVAEFFSALVIGSQVKTSLDSINFAVQDGLMSIEEAEATYPSS